MVARIDHIDEIIAALEQADWQPARTDDHSFILAANVEEGGFFISGVLYADDGLFSTRGNIPVYVPPSAVQRVLAFIHYANARLPVGNFEYDDEAEQVFFRNGLLFRELTPSPQLIHNVVHEVFLAVQDFWGGIAALIAEDKKIEDVFNENYYGRRS